MVISQVHRPIVENHPMGQIFWYKRFEQHDEIHGDNSWIPDLYILLMIYEGQGRLARGDQLFAVNRGSLITLFPGIAHGLRALEGEPLSFTLLGFRGPVFDLWRDSAMLDQNKPILKLTDARAWADRLYELPLGEDTDRKERDLLEICRLQQFLSEVRAEQAGPQCDEDKCWREDVLHRIRSQPYQDLNLQAVARDLGMSYDAFRRRFREQFDQPPRKYHNRLVLEAACQKLLESKDSQREIANSLGFCDEFYFSRFMKKQLGLSPSEYRRRNASL